LTVAQVNALRRLCFNAGVEYVVYKNTMIRKALEKQKGNYEDIFQDSKRLFRCDVLEEVGNAPAKVIKEYRKKLEGKPGLKAASIETALLSVRNT